jgi:hypothetical protein
MEKPKKKLFWTITMILILTVSTFMATISFANAAVTNVDTFAYVAAAPNPSEINKQVLITYGIDKLNPQALINENLFTGFTLTITKPDGTAEIKTSLSVYSMSSGFFTYTPTQVGTYSLQVSFEGQWSNSTDPAYNNWFKPSTSAIYSLKVQQQPIASYPDVPFPTSFWTRPIYGENKGWWQMADNWLMPRYDQPDRISVGRASAWAPFTSAPNSPHVLWTKPIVFGGMVGGPFGDRSYYTGLSYNQLYNSMVIQGRIIFADHAPGSATYYTTRCIDLYTGQEIYSIPNTAIDFGQTLGYENPNQHGIIPYLWSTGSTSAFGISGGENQTWTMYDAFSGREVLQITNVTAGRTLFGPSGELLSYTLDTVNDRLICWNSTQAILNTPGTMGFFLDSWAVNWGIIVDGNNGIQWNVSIPHLPDFQIVVANYKDNAILCFDHLAFDYDLTTGQYPTALGELVFPTTLQRDSNGNYPTSIEPTWRETRTNIYGNIDRTTVDIANGFYGTFDNAKRQVHCYDIKTGREVSVSPPTSDLYWGILANTLCADGKFFVFSYDGNVVCVDCATGNILWKYYLGDSGSETAYGSYPMYSGGVLADGKMYVGVDEHSPDSVMWRGGKLHCIDATTGKGLWNVSGWLRTPTISDGILTALNSYDGQVYTFGKGPSATTVSAPQIAVPKGTALVLTGLVTDQSSGAKQKIETGEFSIVPAVSDQSMSAWMEYVYMQKPKPANAVGVPVKLTAVDVNGNTVDIGTVTSDSSGLYSIEWSPEQTGKYIIKAAFEGTQSYWPSSAETAISVSSADSEGKSGSLDLYIIAGLVLVLIALAIVAVMLIRKK